MGARECNDVRTADAMEVIVHGTLAFAFRRSVTCSSDTTERYTLHERTMGMSRMYGALSACSVVWIYVKFGIKCVHKMALEFGFVAYR